MIGLVLFEGLHGLLNNVFIYLSGQSIGNDIRKDCFGKIMRFSFPQVEGYGTSSLVTRVTNDIARTRPLFPNSSTARAEPLFPCSAA